MGEQTPAPRGELRVVDSDPFNWAWITWNVFEHLVEIDKDGQLVPRLATSWQWLDERTLEMTLRQGVKFHNGEGFDAEIVQLNWDENLRLRQPHRSGDYWNCQPGSRLEIIDPHTVRFVFPEPDGGAMARLVLMHLGNRQFHREVGWGEKRCNWLQVLGTAERTQIYQCIRHPFHAVVSLLDAFKAEQQPLELVLPGKGPLDPQAECMDGGVEEAFAAALRRLAVARILFDVRDEAGIENAFAIVGRIKTPIEVEIGAVQGQPHLFGRLFQRFQALREQDHVGLVDGSHGDRG